MISKKDIEILTHLRKNARKKITTISREVEIPVTTAYDKIRVQEKRYVNKHVSLLNFSKLGLHATANIAIKVNSNSKEALQQFLQKHPNINTLYKVNFGTDFLAEVIFPNMGGVSNFVEKLELNFQINQIQIFNVIEELKKENFLTEPEHFDAL